MKISSTLKFFSGALCLVSLAAVTLVLGTGARTERIDERMRSANVVFEEYLLLSRNSSDLFRLYSDALLLGDDGARVATEALVGAVRSNTREIRSAIVREIEIAGSGEAEELEYIARIDRYIERMIADYEAVLNNGAEDVEATRAALARIVDRDAEAEIRALLEQVVAEEQDEVAEAREILSATFAQNRLIAVLFAGLSVAITYFALRVYTLKILRPLARISKGARRFSAGDFDTPIAMGGRDELSDVARVLDEMAQDVRTKTQGLSDRNSHLEKAVADRTRELERLLEEARVADAATRRMLADVSHELRTPLTIIKGESEIALRGNDKTPSDYREALQRTSQAAAHTAQLVDDLLFIARSQEGTSRLKVERVDLVQLVGDTLSMAMPEVALQTDLSGAEVTADPMRLRQSMLAVLQNARVHGGDRVEVGLHRTPEGYRIDIRDDGPGMSEADLNQAFERFYRGPNAAGRYAEGVGLGLPVVKSILDAHGGSVSLTSPEEGGMRVSLLLPAKAGLKLAV